MSLSVASVKPLTYDSTNRYSSNGSNVSFTKLSNRIKDFGRPILRLIPPAIVGGGGATLLVESLRNKLGMDGLLTTAFGISGLILVAIGILWARPHIKRLGIERELYLLEKSGL